MSETTRVRFEIELRCASDRGIEGVLSGPPYEGGQEFAGWLELLRLLEAVAMPAESLDQPTERWLARSDPVRPPPDQADQ